MTPHAPATWPKKAVASLLACSCAAVGYPLALSAEAARRTASHPRPAPSAAAARFACSGPHSSTSPCHFATPSGNVRCLWTPKPNNVACVLLATGRAYRLRPTGHARRITLRLLRRGQTLPTNQQLVFPGSLSCHDTRTSMTCNQDFGLGAFTLARRRSRAS
ncbi:MAG: hypothetical protein E6G34_07665 [Actinobacteria bacterium]|nr:MAG: hypothetical protein E6G34_07665 [Actinomycetota bacterium]